MSNKLKIHTIGDNVLRSKAEDVFIIDDEIKNIVKSMIQIMYDSSGVGLAANQVGILKKIFIVDVDYTRSGKKNPIIFINPKILKQEGNVIAEEGCLSIPGFYAKVKRPKKIDIIAKNLDNKEFKISAEDFLARAISHENDHLLGVLFVDKLTLLEKIRKRKELKKYLK